ncbi:MAG TPA: hypothetical protein VHI78_07190, partial [Bacteroidales bacterium]|nr:hypothetical protein [Bacteroidales bacterium]
TPVISVVENNIAKEPVPSPAQSQTTRSASPLNISIKDALGKVVLKETKTIEDEEVYPDTEYLNEPGSATGHALTPDLLSIAWNSFADQIREKRPRMAVTLKSVQPVIREQDTIVVELKNRAQLDDFNTSTRSELEKFLRTEIRNTAIIIEAILPEQDENQEVKLYTSEEKFRYLSKKNPGLESFRQKLNLELE